MRRWSSGTSTHCWCAPKMDVDEFARCNLFVAFREMMDDAELEEMRAKAAATVAFFNKLNQENEDILAQYKEKGYAMVEVELMDDASE